MKIFQCDNCGHPLFFESYSCGNCGRLAGYRESDREMLTFDDTNSTLISNRDGKTYKYCKNKEHFVCNWILEEHDTHNFCQACQLNRTIPNLSDKENFPKWKNLEIAKHRLIYQLQKLGLKVYSKNKADTGLCFDFIERRENSKIMTGHASGVITILLSEADSVFREKMRRELSEPYRALIGHLRHEVGHYYWERLVAKNPPFLSEFRAIFGNEELNYSDALKTYYEKGAPLNWQASFISRYATSHPWEDWAETWAHYLHIMDMVETAHFFGIKVHPNHKILKGMDAEVTFDPYTIYDFDKVIQTCVPLSFAVNSINRSMGIPDVYPFVINQAVIEKMKFIHQQLLPKR